MKKYLFLSILLLALSSIETHAAINTKHIGHVAKGLASTGAFGLTAYFTKGILINDIPELNSKIKTDGWTKDNLLVSTLVACLIYTCYRTAKIGYKNFKNAYKDIQTKKQIQNSSRLEMEPELILHAPGISAWEDKNGIHVFKSPKKKQLMKNKNEQKRK